MTPGLEKNIRIPAMVVKNQGFAVLSLGPVLGQFLDPSWAPFWEGIWPPGMLKPVSSAASGRPRAVPQLLFWGPGGFQERSKRPTGGKNKGPQERTIAKRPPRGFPDPLWSHLGRILEPSRDDFDNFGTSWGVVVCIFFSLKQVAEHIKRTRNKQICGVVSGPV